MTHEDFDGYFDSYGNRLDFSQEETEQLDAAFVAALTLPVVRVGFCVFCDETAQRRANGVWRCADCGMAWVDDDDLALLLESEEARAARLAGEYQAAHGLPLFGLAGDGDA